MVDALTVPNQALSSIYADWLNMWLKVWRCHSKKIHIPFLVINSSTERPVGGVDVAPSYVLIFTVKKGVREIFIRADDRRRPLSGRLCNQISASPPADCGSWRRARAGGGGVDACACAFIINTLHYRTCYSGEWGELATLLPLDHAQLDAVGESAAEDSRVLR
ncbi:hypothetical protein EVAR_25354_1 [Eumeta japonica]|uniref:Uncharacterized protein n=1 Tax=Eumeta variegata TaxID=151549 RepID=A0A4C1XWI5_EUMVA|nr:hypothetical protein EVAR_25354_1 [Eumeta japonica]